MAKGKTKYVFKIGERYHLDDIYIVQGIGGNDWWEAISEEDDDDVVITKDITIEIIITHSNAK